MNWRATLNAGFIALVAFGIGGIWGNGVRIDTSELGEVVSEKCVGECDKEYFIATLNFFSCKYSRLFAPAASTLFISRGWTGDTDIPAERTESGKPFPPPLPVQGVLTADEVKKIDEGDGQSLCPTLYNPELGYFK